MGEQGFITKAGHRCAYVSLPGKRTAKTDLQICMRAPDIRVERVGISLLGLEWYGHLPNVCFSFKGGSCRLADLTNKFRASSMFQIVTTKEGRPIRKADINWQYEGVCRNCRSSGSCSIPWRTRAFVEPRPDSLLRPSRLRRGCGGAGYYWFRRQRPAESSRNR